MRKKFSPCLYLYFKFTLIVVFNNGVPEKASSGCSTKSPVLMSHFRGNGFSLYVFIRPAAICLESEQAAANGLNFPSLLLRLK